MKMKYKRRYITLIEMMIVMFLIALITGVIAFNYRGALEEGKAFKTKTGIEKLETILSLKIAETPNAADDMETRWRDYVADSPLVQNPKTIIKDGWGQEYKVSMENGRVVVTSEKYETYKKANPGKFGEE